MMNFVTISRLVAPEAVEVLEERYLLLKHISFSQPIGRRALAADVNLSERIVRSQVEVMKDNGLLEFTSQGMVLTSLGSEVLPELAKQLYVFNRTNELASDIAKSLRIEAVHIVDGNSTLAMGKHQLGLEAAKVLLPYIKPESILAVSGGSTLAAMADALPIKTLKPVVIPARGGFGERVENQANVIAATIAEKTGGSYHMLHMPDGLSADALAILSRMEPQVKAIVDLSQRVDVLVFGIGRALQMATQRHVSDEQQSFLQEGGAVGEALGYYCDLQGNVICATNNVGIAMEQISHIPCVLAVAGGQEKAKAIIAVMRACRRGILVIDESAALEIKKELRL